MSRSFEPQAMPPSVLSLKPTRTPFSESAYAAGFVASLFSGNETGRIASDPRIVSRRRIAMRRFPRIDSLFPQAFALIELLVAIAIVSILAAILFPVYASARSRSRQAACFSNLRQIHLAAMTYAYDYDVALPPVRSDWALPEGASPEENAAREEAAKRDPGCLSRLLAPYARSHSLFSCPSDVGMTLPQYVGSEPRRETMFERFGTSYRQASEVTDPDFGIRDPQSVFYLADASGYWHPGSLGNRERFGRIDVAKWRIDMIFLDGHARSLSFREVINSPFPEFLSDEY
jgi:general secretion pathway protein G